MTPAFGVFRPATGTSKVSAVSSKCTTNPDRLQRALHVVERMKESIQLQYLARPLMSLALADPGEGKSWNFFFPSLLLCDYEVIWGKETHSRVG